MWIIGRIFEWIIMMVILTGLFGGAALALVAGVTGWRGWLYVSAALAMIGVVYLGIGWLRADAVAECQAHYAQLIEDQKEAEQAAIDRADDLAKQLTVLRAERNLLRTLLEAQNVAEIEAEAEVEEAERQEIVAATGICPACTCADSQRDIDRLQSLWR